MDGLFLLEKNLGSLVNSLSDPLFVKDRQHRWVLFNDALCKLVRHTREELMGKSDYDFFPRQEADIFWANDELVFISGEENVNEEEITDANNEIHVIITKKTPHTDDEGNKYIIGLIRDITAQKVAERALKESERKLSTLVANLPGIAYRCRNDKNWTMEDISEGCYELTGYQPSELLNNSRLSFNDLISDEFKSYIWETWQKVLKEHGKFHAEYKIKNAKGETRWVMEKGVGVYGPDNEVISLEGFITDITESKNYETALMIAKDRAEKSDRLKTEFLAQMSHEIRTPINTMLNYIQLVRDDLVISENPDDHEYFTAINKSSERIIRTIDLILNMSEIQAGSYECVFRELKLYGNILDRIVMELKLKAKRRNLILTLHKTDTDFLITADEYSLEQIFMNLIDNAIKYTQAGRIEVSSFKDELDRLCVSVKDTGIGMTEEYMAQLFTPFTQEEQGYTRKYEGSGLGLSLVKRYCDMNNFGIEVSSQKGQGSVFTIIFDKYKLFTV